MELSEEITALKAEVNQLKQVNEYVSAEKIALDQLFVQTLKNSVEDKRSLVLAQIKAQKDDNEIRQLKSENEAVRKQLDEHLKEKHVTVVLSDCEENAA